MDGERFDFLTRRFSARSTRRATLRGLLAAVAGGTGLARSADAAAVQRRPGELCRKDGECASGICGPADATGRRRCGAAPVVECAGTAEPSIPCGSVCCPTVPCGCIRTPEGPVCVASGVCCFGACSATAQCQEQPQWPGAPLCALDADLGSAGGGYSCITVLPCVT